MIALPEEGHHEAEGLEVGQLSSPAAISLSIASFFPAVSIATAPAFVMMYAGNDAWLSMLASMIAVIAVGLCIIPFAKRYVVTGSLYSFITHVFGDWAKIAIAASLAIGYLVCQMAVVLAFGLYAGSFLVRMGIDAGAELVIQIPLYAVAALISGFVAYRGLDASVRVAVTLMVISVPIILFVIIASAMHTGFQLESQLSLDGLSLSGVSQGMALGASFLVLFESSSSLAKETRDPKRVMPWVIMSVPVVIGAALVVFTILQIPGLLQVSDQLAAGASPPAALAENAGLGFFADIVDLVLAIATFATIIGFLNFASRIWATMAGDGLLPKGLARIHPRHHTPAAAILLITIVSFVAPVLLVVVTGDTPLEVYSYGSTLITYFWVVPYVLICAGAVVFLRRIGRLTIVTVLSAVIGIAAFSWIYLNGIINPGPSPIDAMSWVALAGLAIGVVFFAITNHRARRAAVVPEGTSQSDEIDEL